MTAANSPADPEMPGAEDVVADQAMARLKAETAQAEAELRAARVKFEAVLKKFQADALALHWYLWGSNARPGREPADASDLAPVVAARVDWEN